MSYDCNETPFYLFQSPSPVQTGRKEVAVVAVETGQGLARRYEELPGSAAPATGDRARPGLRLRRSQSARLSGVIVELRQAP